MVALPEAPQRTVDAVMDALVTAHYETPQAHYKGYGISVSALGTVCDRQLWMSLRWASDGERLTGRTLRIFRRGNEAEERIINDLRRAGLDVQDVDPATGRQWRLSIVDGWLRGRADGVILSGVLEAPRARHVLEIKCIKAADWRAIQKHGLREKKPEHWHQLHMGMAALGIERGLYVAENADTMELLTERLHLDHEEVARQQARVMRAVEDHEPPLGMLGDATTEIKSAKIRGAPPCRFCDHAPVCFDGALAKRSCRTCLHWTFGADGNGHCARFDEPKTPAQQQEGARCPAHLFLPGLVAGDVIDGDSENETITYQMRDGTEWTDGAHAPEAS